MCGVALVDHVGLLGAAWKGTIGCGNSSFKGEKRSAGSHLILRSGLNNPLLNHFFICSKVNGPCVLPFGSTYSQPFAGMSFLESPYRFTGCCDTGFGGSRSAAATVLSRGTARGAASLARTPLSAASAPSSSDGGISRRSASMASVGAAFSGSSPRIICATLLEAEAPGTASRALGGRYACFLPCNPALRPGAPEPWPLAALCSSSGVMSVNLELLAGSGAQCASSSSS
mmetsp:Transcript_2795/g.7373  ORF Transcript_2795/g.7373 Transcript_2795/m.7373 type:complete len:229 (-) Transcript_2795:1729-2415(-)